MYYQPRHLYIALFIIIIIRNNNNTTRLAVNYSERCLLLLLLVVFEDQFSLRWGWLLRVNNNKMGR